MKTIKDLKQMISEPASKEWFEKHGGAKKAIAKKMGRKEAFQKQQEDVEKKRWGKTSGVKY